MPIEFTPTSSKFANQKCGGVNIVITDRARFEPLRTGFEIAAQLRRLYPDDWEAKGYDRLLGNAKDAAGAARRQIGRRNRGSGPRRRERVSPRRRQKYLDCTSDAHAMRLALCSRQSASNAASPIRRAVLRGARFGLLMNQASVDRSFRYACDLLAERFPGQLAAIFSPQHGLWGEAAGQHDRVAARPL